MERTCMLLVGALSFETGSKLLLIAFTDVLCHNYILNVKRHIFPVV